MSERPIINLQSDQWPVIASLVTTGQNSTKGRRAHSPVSVCRIPERDTIIVSSCCSSYAFIKDVSDLWSNIVPYKAKASPFNRRSEETIAISILYHRRRFGPRRSLNTWKMGICIEFLFHCLMPTSNFCKHLFIGESSWILTMFPISVYGGASSEAIILGLVLIRMNAYTADKKEKN